MLKMSIDFVSIYEVKSSTWDLVHYQIINYIFIAFKFFYLLIDYLELCLLHYNQVLHIYFVIWCYFKLTTVMILINLALQVYDDEEAIHSE